MKTNLIFLKAMQRKIGLIALIIGVMLAGVGAVYAAPASLAGTARAAEAPSLLQFSAGVHALGFTPQGMYAATGSHALRVDFVNANNVQPQTEATASHSISLTDNKAASLGRVVYADLWEGVTLAYTASAGSIYTTTYSLAPGADAKNICLRYNAPLTLNPNGTLSIAFKTGMLTESAPIAWQNINGKRVPVDSSFRVRGQEVAFAIGKYDPRHPLTIDPSLTWNTFLGGSGDDYSRSIAIDGNGNVYITGNSTSAWSCSPTDCTVLPYTGDYDAFIAKLDISSGALVWNTFLGGNGFDDSMGITFDGNGNIYVSGYSTDTWGSPLRGYGGGGADGFVAKLDGSSGALTWNTFLGGTDTDRSWGVAVDGDGNSYVSGNSLAAWSCSPTDCTVRAFGVLEDAYIAKLDSSGLLLWNTFLGGSGADVGSGIIVDGSGKIYMAGDSGDTWGSPLRIHQGGVDAFAAKLDGTSGALIWNTFLGGNGTDHGYGIAVDGNGNVYVAGSSYTAWGNPLRDFGGGTADAFAAKLDGASGALTWNTFLGGSGYDYGYGITVDGIGNVYMAGGSDAAWGNPSHNYAGNLDGFAAKLDGASGALTKTSFLGGSGNDKSYGIAVFGGDENVYVSGYGDAAWGSPLRAYTGGKDAFAAKVDFIFLAHLPLVMR